MVANGGFKMLFHFAHKSPHDKNQAKIKKKVGIFHLAFLTAHHTDFLHVQSATATYDTTIRILTVRSFVVDRGLA
jgi:hypothetical protein